MLEREFKVLCTYDAAMCVRLREKHGLSDAQIWKWLRCKLMCSGTNCHAPTCLLNFDRLY